MLGLPVPDLPCSHAMYNQAVPNLPCSQLYNQAVPNLLCSQSTIKHAVMFPMYTVHFHRCGTLTWAWSILQTTPLLYSPQVSATPLWNWELLLNTWERKRQKSATCPCTKIEYFHQDPEYFSCSSAVPSPFSCYTGNPMQVRNSCRCVHASTLTIIKWSDIHGVRIINSHACLCVCVCVCVCIPVSPGDWRPFASTCSLGCLLYEADRV